MREAIIFVLSAVSAGAFHAAPFHAARGPLSGRYSCPLLSADADVQKADLSVSEAAVAAKELLKAEKQAALDLKLDAVLQPPGDEHYIMHERPTLVGEISSSELLDRDEAAGFWPADLEPGADSTAKQMVFVDEISCTGCAWCPHVGRSTFAMGEDYGKARAHQQGEDALDTIEESRDICPAECIHFVTRDELRVLEEHRELHLESTQAEGWSQGGSADWREPLENDGWRRTENTRSEQKPRGDLD